MADVNFHPAIRRFMAAALLCSGSLFAAAKNGPAAKDAGANFNIPLWQEGSVPLATGNGPLDNPFLTVFPAPEGKANGGSVVIAPGGSNIMLMYGAEGMDIAERYNEWGVTAFVLTYRMSPHYKDDARILDGNRSVQVVRSRAAEFKLDPKRVGFIGFSAGSNMGRLVVAASKPGDSNAADPVSRFSSKPDYLGLVYGPGRPTPGESLKDFPPTFLLAAENDKGASLGTAQLFMDLTKAGAVAEIHIYQKGRHGFGSGFASPNFSDWMPRLEHFLKVDGFLPGDK
jgi:acetyl esterase/lipase